MTTTTTGAGGRRLKTAAAAAAVLAALTVGSASAAAAPSQPTRKTVASLTAKALFAEVHHAYLHVPAVELSVVPGGSTYRFSRRFVFILRSGVVVAEDFTRSGCDATTLVARRHHPTYSRLGGAKCWRRLPSSNPQTLTDVGIPFPYTRSSVGIGGKVLPPRRTPFGWTEATENRAEFWFLTLQPKRPAHLLDGRHLPIKRFINYAIYRKSHLLKNLFIQQPKHKLSQKKWLHATLRVSSLPTAPRLPAPTPAC